MNPSRHSPRTLAGARLLLGLVQGFALYALIQAKLTGAWLAGTPVLFLPIVLSVFLVPVLISLSMGALAGRGARRVGSGCDLRRGRSHRP